MDSNHPMPTKPKKLKKDSPNLVTVNMVPWKKTEGETHSARDSKPPWIQNEHHQIQSLLTSEECHQREVSKLSEAHAHRPLTASSPAQGRQAASHEPREELPSVAKQLKELAKIIHLAIRQKDLGVLKFQVIRYGKATWEVKNEQGMTPLYHALLSDWTRGALFLVRSGANINKSEEVDSEFSGPPFLWLVMQNQDCALLAEVIRRGANIRARDYEGDYGVDFSKLLAKEALFDCLAETVADEGCKRQDLLKDLLFIVRAGAVFREIHSKIEQFITRHGGCHQAKMFQVLAACCCCEPISDYNQALRYCTKSAECTPRQSESQTAEEELAHGSVFADIFHVKEHPLPNRVTTRADRLAIDIHALFALEKIMPESDLLVMVCAKSVLHLLGENPRAMATACTILRRLSGIRHLYSKEVKQVLDKLFENLKLMTEEPAVPVHALLDSMKTIENCLASPHLKTKHNTSDSDDYWNGFFRGVFKALILAIVLFYRHEDAATPEQLQTFASHVKHCVRDFPWTRWDNFLHLLASEELCAPIPASTIKVIVTCCAEAFGIKRQEKSPPHLVSDENGNTLLHTVAMYRSREELVQEGLLQCFLDHGAHLCTRNNRGQTVRGILVKGGVYTEGELLPSLQCLAAAAFMGNWHLHLTVEKCCPAAVRNFLLDH